MNKNSSGKNDSADLTEDRTTMAEKRTDYAEDRTILANERTFAGWGRTALASIGIGLGFQALFREIEPAWVPKLIATLFFILAIFIIWSAQGKASQLVQRLETHDIEVMGSSNFRMIAIVITFAAISVSAAILVLT